MSEQAKGEESPADHRISHILAVAQAEFLANGFADTTMDGVARAARISKQTLYAHFRDKADLFEAVIVEDMRRFHDMPDLTADTRDPADVLFEAARWIYDNHIGSASVAMSRILITAAGKFGSLIKRHHEFRFQSAVSWIESYIAWLAERGVLRTQDAHRAAIRFALMASEGTSPIMGGRPASVKDRERYARMTVAMFLRGLDPKGASA